MKSQRFLFTCLLVAAFVENHANLLAQSQHESFEMNAAVKFSQSVLCSEKALTAHIGGLEISQTALDRIIIGDSDVDLAPLVTKLTEKNVPHKLVARDYYPIVLEFKGDGQENDFSRLLWNRSVGSLLVRFASVGELNLTAGESLLFDDCSSCQPDFVYIREPQEKVLLTQNNAPAKSCDFYAWQGSQKLNCSISAQGGSPRIAIIDTAINFEHAELVQKRSPTLAFDAFELSTPSLPQHLINHGTLMAIAVAGATYGVCRNAEIVPVRVLRKGSDSEADCGYYSNIIAGLNYSVDNGIPIVSFSLNPASSIPELEAAFSKAASSGVLIAASAGNDGLAIANVIQKGHITTYPISYHLSNVIGVTGTLLYGANEEKTPWNYSKELVTLAAPGFLIDTAGTSIATARVAATLAELLTHHPSSAVPQKLEELVVPLSSLTDKVATGGRLCLKPLVVE